MADNDRRLMGRQYPLGDMDGRSVGTTGTVVVPTVFGIVQTLPKTCLADSVPWIYEWCPRPDDSVATNGTVIVLIGSKDSYTC